LGEADSTPTRRLSQPEDEHSSAAALLRNFADGLALKTVQRRWSAFEFRAGALLLVAQAGGALESESEEGHGSRPSPVQAESLAISRAAATGRSVAFHEADPRLSLHPKAASGVAVPLRLGHVVRGVWLVESTRRRDFSSADLQRFEARAELLAPELAAAQFCAWHRARYGHDAFVADPSAGLDPQQLVAMAASNAPIALCGPLGAGRRMLARRLHFESAARAQGLRRVLAGWDELQRALADTALDDSLILERVQDLQPAQQAWLARALEDRAAERPRVFVLLDTAPAALLAAGNLAAELAWLLSRLELRLAPLCQRRGEILPLAQLFAAHFALEQGRRPPQLEDSALALLWRQPWPGNVRELAQWMYRLALSPSPAHIDAEFLEAFAARFGHTPLRRLPTRNPERESLRAALALTATRKGGWNKTRAALYLGWDTDTLNSRLVDARLTESGAAGSAKPEHCEPASEAGDGPLPSA
jgi:transcriptional regulator with AAA-type ATPase domain